MISETDIVSGYLWVLGRVPCADEIARCRDHYAMHDTETVRSFQASLLTSEEFRDRRLLMLRTRAWTRSPLDASRLAFVHIEKCGGTTLHEMLRSQFPADRVCPERHASIGDWTVNELAGYDLFSGHFDMVYCRSIPGRVRTITMLREPKARLFSLYRFWKSHRPHADRDLYELIRLARDHDAEAFFSHETVRSHTVLRDGMVGQLTRSRAEWSLPPDHGLLIDPARMLDLAQRALREMTGFGITERFEESRRLLNHRLGLDMQPIPARQVLSDMVQSDETMIALPPEPMTPRLDALLTSMTRVDGALYRYATTLFDQRVRKLNDAPTGIAASARSGGLQGWTAPFATGWRRLDSWRERPSAGISP